jgi:hypothetical protein
MALLPLYIVYTLNNVTLLPLLPHLFDYMNFIIWYCHYCLIIWISSYGIVTTVHCIYIEHWLYIILFSHYGIGSTVRYLHIR